MTRRPRRGLITMPTLTSHIPASRKPRPSRSRRLMLATVTPGAPRGAADHVFVTPVVREIRHRGAEPASIAALW